MQDAIIGNTIKHISIPGKVAFGVNESARDCRVKPAGWRSITQPGEDLNRKARPAPQINTLELITDDLTKISVGATTPSTRGQVTVQAYSGFN